MNHSVDVARSITGLVFMLTKVITLCIYIIWWVTKHVIWWSAMVYCDLGEIQSSVVSQNSDDCHVDHTHIIVTRVADESHWHWPTGKKVKEVDLYSAFIVVLHTQGAQVRITQCYLQITPYLPLPRKHSPDGASPDWGWLVAWHSGRTSVSDRRTFAVLHSTYCWQVTTYVGKPSAVGQPTRPTQLFILSG